MHKIIEMKNYLSEAQERAKLNWKTESEQEAFISGVQWFISQPEIIKLLSQPTNIDCIDMPEWLTDEVCALAKVTWNEHVDFNDNKRVEAMRIIQRAALDAGYTITITKATELLRQYCL